MGDPGADQGDCSVDDVECSDSHDTGSRHVWSQGAEHRPAPPPPDTGGSEEHGSSSQLVVTLLSAQGLKDVCMFGTMSPYAVTWINPQVKHSTPVARNGGKAPVWDSKICLALQPRHVGDNASLSIQIFNRGAVQDTLIGGVSMPLQEVMSSKGEFMACQLLRPSGRIQGVVNLSVQFLQDGHVKASSPMHQGDETCCWTGSALKPDQEHGAITEHGAAAGACNDEGLALRTCATWAPAGHQGDNPTFSLQSHLVEEHRQPSTSGQHHQEDPYEQWHQDPSDNLEKDRSPFSNNNVHWQEARHGEVNAAVPHHHCDTEAAPSPAADTSHPRRRLSGYFTDVAPDDLDMVNISEQGHAPLPEGRAGGAAPVDAASPGPPGDCALGVGIGLTGGDYGAAVLMEAIMIDAAAAISGDASSGHIF